MFGQTRQRKILWIMGLALATSLPASELRAWGEHALASYPALAAMPEFRQARPIKVESLEAFLRAREKGLALVLAKTETELSKTVPEYPTLPAALAFKKGSGNIRTRFLRAIRINPKSVLPLYLQLLPGQKSTRKKLTPGSVMFLKHTAQYYAKTGFVALKAGDSVSPLAVTATATDEPDFGLDVGLYNNNRTEFGKHYGFGEQPFGRPELEYGSQPPFHMGFYHESGIVYSLAGFLKRTLPEYRVLLFGRLAEFAFREGHDYWGYRFLGWALHYVQDLTQPYHARVLPGWSTASLLWINLLSTLGISGPRKDAIQLVSNRHLAIESFQRRLLVRLHAGGETSHVVLRALKSDPAKTKPATYKDSYLRSVLTRQASDFSEQLDQVLLKRFPPRLVDDPTFELSESKEEKEILNKPVGPGGVKELEETLARLLGSFGTHSRVYARAVLKNGKK